MQRSLFFVISVLLLTTLGVPINAELPVCVLGGPTAMDTNRQLGPGETFVFTDRPLAVHLQFRPTKEHPERIGQCRLPSNTEVAQKNGVLVWVRACGNNEVNRNILVAPVPTPTPAPTAPPQIIRETKTREIIREVPAPTPTPVPLKWGLTGGVSRESYSGPIADRELCKIDSWSIFGGVAYGDPTRLFARATFMAVLVEDGSSSSYLCSNCGTVTTITEGMKVFGGELEGVLLVGPKSWEIYPTFFASVGGGVVTGGATRYVTNGTSTNIQQVGADQFLGWSTMAHGGGGAGITARWIPAVNVEASFKYRYPYGWSLGITITKWFGK